MKAKYYISKFIKALGISLGLFSIVTILGTGIVYLKVRPLINNAKVEAYDKLSTIDEETFIMAEDTEIFDKDNNKIGEINITNFKYISINEIPQYIQNGYIAVEDMNFKTHNGIDYGSLARAGIALIKNKGTITQGGSTITQQVLKNKVIGTDIDKWERKLIEFFLAPEFEKMFTKSDIMEFYCNSNYYANGCYGVGTASQYYFGKQAKDMSLSECALLIGISNAPTRYNPVTNYNASIEKRDFVLSRMFEEGYITADEFNRAKAEEINLVLEKDERTKESYVVSFAIHSATLSLMEKDGFEFKYTFKDKEEYSKYKEEYNSKYALISNEIRSGGYDIYTSFDMDKQEKLQEIVDKHLSKFTEKAEDGRYTMQGSATLVDNSTGYVVALVGGRGTEDEFNRAYQGFRQAGSSIKPLVVYAPAFETGDYYPSLKIKDEQKEGYPKNATNSYRGYTSIREAIARSINTIPYKILEDIGVSTGIKYLDKLKFSGLSYQDNYNKSMALGGFTYGTTTFEMAKAYSSLVNGGEYIDNSCIREIVYRGTDTIYKDSHNTINIYSKDTSYMILDTLKDVIYKSYGTGGNMKVAGQIVAGKTGTTNDNKDAWFVGVTDYYSLAVWCGYDIPKEIPNVGAGKYSGDIFVDMMDYVHKGLSEKDFKKQSTVVEKYIDKDGKATDKDTGNTDIFSKYLEEKRKAEEEQQKLLEQQRKEEEIQKAEAEKISQLKLDIADFGTYTINSLSDLDDYDDTYNSLRKQILSLLDNGIKNEYILELNTYYNTVNGLNLVQQLRKEKADEEERKREEEERKQLEKAEAEAKLKMQRLAQADLDLSELSTWEEDTYKELASKALKSIENCKDYGEYKLLMKQYRKIEEEYKEFISSKEENNSYDDNHSDNDSVYKIE